MLRKRPGFTLAAVLSLALGIGANTAIFTLVNAVFLSPLPVRDMERLVAVYGQKQGAPTGGLRFSAISLPDYQDFRDRNKVFSGLAAYRWTPLSLATGGEAVQIPAQIVSSNFFDVLGVRPYLGRTFQPNEDGPPGAHPVVVLSNGIWERRFGSDRSLVGKTITLNRQAFTVVGVAAEGFTGPSKLGPVELWIPLSMYSQVSPPVPAPDKRSSRLFFLLGRLKPGVDFDTASAGIRSLARQLELDFPETSKGWGVAALPLSQAMTNPNQQDVLSRSRTLMMGATALVLLIAAINVANMLLARGVDRYGEMAVRISQGATRGRLIRQLLTESLLLALVGGGAGLLLAVWGRNVVWGLRPPRFLESSLHLSLDDRVLGFTLLITVAVGLLFGLVPALQSTRPELVAALKERVGLPGGSRRLNLRNLFVVLQIAICLTSLAGAGLFLRSLQNARQIDSGYDADHLLLASVDLAAEGYDEPRARIFFQRLMEDLRSEPGVAGATLAENRLLYFTGLLQSITVEGQAPAADSDGPLIRTNGVEPRYFETLGIPVVQGRVFRETDRKGSAMVAVVNQTLANQFWPGQSPIGRRFRFQGEPPDIEVVGVARDADYVSLGEDPQPYIYVPLAQFHSSAATIYLRSSGDPAALVPALRRRVQALDPSLPLINVRTMPELIDGALWGPKTGAILLTAFGLLGLILASLGIYGVMAYSVSQRNREFGIRMALGASGGDLRRLVLGEGLKVTMVGIAVGVLAAFGITRLIRTLLFGVEAADPLSLGAVAVLLILVSLAASYLPARRAALADPVTALRRD